MLMPERCTTKQSFLVAAVAAGDTAASLLNLQVCCYTSSSRQRIT
jgi:hypothetical protein